MIAFSDIYEAYYDGCVGDRQPTAIGVSVADWDSVRLRYSDFERHLRIDNQPLDHLIFNGIPLMRDASLADGSIMIVNDKYPADPQFNFTRVKQPQPEGTRTRESK